MDHGTLPILFLDGRAIGDSTHIIAAPEERYAESPLYPRDVTARQHALALHRGGSAAVSRRPAAG
ncbi:MAG TPA: hypothetical protein VN325_34745 [Steroidobacteraceae bacterium]|nr:hypothetical protein [Steroidobacteraceae bacterium]